MAAQLHSPTIPPTQVAFSQLLDNIGRTVGYQYDASGRLFRVTDPENGVTEYTYEWQSGTDLLLSVTDNLGAGRKTASTYYPNGNVQTVTRLAGTVQAVTTSYTYEPMFNQLASVTDPLFHQTTFGYDASGKLMSITNALVKTWAVNLNSAGQRLSITSPAPISATTYFGYTGADLTTITDPLVRTTTRVPD